MEKTFYKFIGSHVGNAIGSILLCLFFYKAFAPYGTFAIWVCSIFVAIYLWMLNAPKYRWNEKKYLLFFSVLVILSCMVHFFYPGYPNYVLLPLLIFLAAAEPKWARTTTVLSGITGIILMLFISSNLFPYQEILMITGIYVSVRSTSKLKEAYQKNQKQLKELDEAHAELQETTLLSMRYAAFAERTKLAREIHDGLGHQMTSLIIQLQALKIMLKKKPTAANESVDDLLKVARKGMEEIRTAVREWTSDEKDLGLTSLKGLISQVQANSLLQIEFIHSEKISEWTMEESTIMYRILQESLTNILRHAHADFVIVSVIEIDGVVSLSVADNGIFKGDKELELGFGLNGMKKRCELVGGSCSFTLNEPKGLRVEARIPIHKNGVG
ncbi:MULTISPECIES: sensor histidine kinase [Bacillus]|uniref:histidine kinase n=2 Tax=Bacillus cereus group TaxID=86661 RepID=A0A2A7D179_BACAN|nr:MULTISPECIES: sensor histidine kinase [Bacillus]MCP1163182.1 sensor histidine kinase [Bacillus sp. 1813sda1]MDC7972450.1 sensor histidine kinase [Bacillus sp. BLCC-B18]OTW65095.1 two-component sensor histidine kinase [Bacillus thuringiensis serovar coreanensis]OTX49074.1 two-component sensor histidine kinase [Bacillus thuringiensis serovar sooncheon]OTX57749.1 two-component sensor histidine kinase [Bacillus thuringiensis serovar guiyangiensis]